MELTVTILAAVMVATTAFYLLQVYKFDLQMMQQNSYRNERYFKWWRMSKDYASMRESPTLRCSCFSSRCFQR